MKRFWLGLGIALATTACSSQQTASENSADSVRTTAIANIVAAIPSPTPTPSGASDPDNAAATASQSDLSNMVSNLQSQD
jgi:hypothetical protein